MSIIGVWIGAFLAVFFWGSNFHAISALTQEVGPITMTWLRFGVAALVVSPYAVYITVIRHPLSAKQYAYLTGLALLGVVMQNVSMFAALRYTSPMNGAIIMANMPLICILLSAWLLKTPVYARHIVGVLLSLLGVILVLTNGQLIRLTANIGDLGMLVAAISGSLYTVLLVKWVKTLPSYIVVGWTLGLGSLVMMIMAFALEHPLEGLAALEHKDWGLLIYMGLCGTLLAYFFWIKAARVLGPRATASTTNLIPVFTLVIAVLLGQWMTSQHLAGVALVVFGVYWANRHPRQASSFSLSRDP